MPTAATLPAIDISRFRGPERDAFLARLRVAAHAFGFFYVTGHGVPTQVRQQVLETAREFFALPEQARLEIENVNSPQYRGYTRTGTEHTAGSPDWREQIDVGPERAAVDPGSCASAGRRGPAEVAQRRRLDRLGALAGHRPVAGGAGRFSRRPALDGHRAERRAPIACAAPIRRPGAAGRPPARPQLWRPRCGP